MIKLFRNISFLLIVLISVVSNFYNYFINYKLNNDALAQWRLAMLSIASVLFLFSFRMWLGESLKSGNRVKIVISGWLLIYMSINLIGVAIGYTLHTKAFMMILFTIVFFGIAHILVKLWEKYY